MTAKSISQNFITTHYHDIVDTQSGLDNVWLTVLWSFANDLLQSRYWWEAFEQWNKINEKAAEVNAELEKRGQLPLLPAKMFLQVYSHLASMGLGILTMEEYETGYGDSNLKEQLNRSIAEYDKESREVAREKQAANKKRLKVERDQKKAEQKDTTPGVEDAGASADAGPQIANNIVMPAFPL